MTTPDHLMALRISLNFDGPTLKSYDTRIPIPPTKHQWQKHCNIYYFINHKSNWQITEEKEEIYNDNVFCGF